MSADFMNYNVLKFGFAWGTNDFNKVSMEHYFFDIFSHISAGCQLIEKINVDLQYIINALYKIAILTLEH